jgi:omega-6 fatty acid desaturase (delta-12 desaturase)
MRDPDSAVADVPKAQAALAALNALVAPYKESRTFRSLRQVADTAVPFAVLWIFSCLSLRHGHPWLSFLLTIPAAGLILRLFIIQHDCGHGSFFKAPWANDLLGAIVGVLTLTPYRYWRQTHALHHATSGNLDRRGWGDIDTLTVREYRARSAWGRFKYRVYRSVPVLFLIGPAFHFIIYHRLPGIVPADWRTERLSILGTDLTLAALLLLASRTIGVGAFLRVQLPISVMAACAGVALFYVQHQFEGAYWRKDQDWDFAAAGLEGSSFLELGPILNWISGDIGVHHIHHLNSRIPNYNLRRCLAENPVFQKAKRLTLLDSFKCARLALWDEDRLKLVGFRAVP